MAGASGVKIQWLIGQKEGAPNFFLRRFTIAPGGFTPKHTHSHEHEVYCLAGDGEVFLDGEWKQFSPDYVIFVPPNEIHQFRNRGDKDLIFLCAVPRE
ncbi:hypothetical protein DRQ33_02675 [bacterium]|nr:MAG: hypothetical protein DRQ33_02675 [bacterium]